MKLRLLNDLSIYFELTNIDYYPELYDWHTRGKNVNRLKERMC